LKDKGDEEMSDEEEAIAAFVAYMFLLCFLFQFFVFFHMVI